VVALICCLIITPIWGDVFFGDGTFVRTFRAVFMKNAPIGIFDSGFGGLTVFRDIVRVLPDYDYLYLGDNARAPYGGRSFETIYRYTLECVEYLFAQGCPLVILACNTASAKALRNIQQLDLPKMEPWRRVLGVIRPTTEHIGRYTTTGHVGIMATPGTVQSESYILEIEKLWPELHVWQEACPMWVPLIENNEYNQPGADYFIKQHIERLLAQSPDIDTIVLGCTHYPLMLRKIRQFTPDHIQLLAQGSIVADQLSNYLYRHPDMDARLSRGGTRQFQTTDTPEHFNVKGNMFWGEPLSATHADVG
jgi:glutamate racemase